MVRKKSGKGVEFGNKLLIVENKTGLIVDYDFMKKQKNDSKLLIPIVKRVIKNHAENKIKPITIDRGFVGKKNNNELEKKNIYNGICPRNVDELSEKLKDLNFQNYQKRRAQTEGRISILKNVFIGDVLRSKGFKNKERMIAIKIFVHNLLVILRLPKIDEVNISEKKIA